MTIFTTNITDSNGVGHHVEVSAPTGSNGAVHVFIDRYFVGQVVPGPNGRIAYLESPLLYAEDITAIVELVEQWDNTNKKQE